jgi:hypothetical protein
LPYLEVLGIFTELALDAMAVLAQIVLMHSALSDITPIGLCLHQTGDCRIEEACVTKVLHGNGWRR